jgi:hypothetical protein
VRQIALNLLLNACAASPPGGRVTVRAGIAGGVLTLVVADEGPGLPAEARGSCCSTAAPSGVPQAAASACGPSRGWSATSAPRSHLAGPPGTHVTIRIPDAERRADLVAA